MGRHREKPNNQLPMWSELCPDLLRCVFKRLSFIDFVRAKFVCSGWYNLPSRDCNPKPIPCVIIFPPKKKTDNSSNNRCVLFVPGGDKDKDSVYKTRDLGVGFAMSSCLATYGCWLLMFEHPWEIYILNILTLERIDLPRPHTNYYPILDKPSCLWIDDITKEYLVLWSVKSYTKLLYTKNGDDSWRNIDPTLFGDCEQIVYNHKDHKVYVLIDGTSVNAGFDKDRVCVWDFSGDNPSQEGSLLSSDFQLRNTYGRDIMDLKKCIALTVSGQVLRVDCFWRRNETWHFHIYKLDTQEEQKWVKVDSLGDEALILDIGHTIVANDITGIKRNSIYFYDRSNYSKPKDQIFVYDLTTRTMEITRRTNDLTFPSYNRWFFLGLTG